MLSLLFLLQSKWLGCLFRNPPDAVFFSSCKCWFGHMVNISPLQKWHDFNKIGACMIGSPLEDLLKYSSVPQNISCSFICKTDYKNCCYSLLSDLHCVTKDAR